jgi:hypothetical protein
MEMVMSVTSFSVPGYYIPAAAAGQAGEENFPAAQKFPLACQ